MGAEVHEERVTIRELQRNAAEVFDRAHNGQNFVVTRHGETVGRILPPDPLAEALEQAVADGVLDRDVVDGLPSTAEDFGAPRESSPPGTRLGSDAITALRAERTDW